MFLKSNFEKSFCTHILCKSNFLFLNFHFNLIEMIKLNLNVPGPELCQGFHIREEKPSACYLIWNVFGTLRFDCIHFEISQRSFGIASLICKKTVRGQLFPSGIHLKLDIVRKVLKINEEVLGQLHLICLYKNQLR